MELVKVFCSWTKLTQNQTDCYVKLLCNDKKGTYLFENLKFDAFSTDKKVCMAERAKS
jgi:hypothetical protein